MKIVTNIGFQQINPSLHPSVFTHVLTFLSLFNEIHCNIFTLCKLGNLFWYSETLMCDNAVSVVYDYETDRLAGCGAAGTGWCQSRANIVSEPQLYSTVILSYITLD